jgi:hypothetical protein
MRGLIPLDRDRLNWLYLFQKYQLAKLDPDVILNHIFNNLTTLELIDTILIFLFMVFLDKVGLVTRHQKT